MWQQLGIAPTDDEASIRSAFRAGMLALKRRGLHEDVDHVQPLRAAYASALRAATGAAEPGAGDRPAPPAASSAEAAATAPVAPAPDLDQQAAAPVEDLDVLAADAVHLFIRSQVPPSHLPSRWRRLCQQPEWQRPAAARALQQALALRLLEMAPTLRAHQATSATVLAAMRLSQRWLAFVVFVADLHRWWPPQPPGDAAHLPAAGALWDLACSISVDQLLQLLHRREDEAACSHLQRWLQLPVMQALDNRAAWLSACAGRLGQWPDVPAALIETLLQGFDLHELQAGEHVDPAIDALVVLYQAQQGPRLLHRIVRGLQPHPVISPQLAAALLQPAITPADEQAVRAGRLVDGKPWLGQVRDAIAWLREHAPEALDPTEPPVLRWWCGPHVTPRDWWELAMLLGAVVGSVGGLLLFGWIFGAGADVAGNPGHLAGLLAVLLAGMAAGAWAGLRTGVAVTWLHMHWCTGIYPAWRRQDAIWARRIPLVGSLLPRLNIWLSRDLLVLWGLLQFGETFTPTPWIAFVVWRLALRVAARGSF